ncbi:MAG: hypothetical protein ACOC4K_01255 [Verrucomicrobiota bacterium]
MKFGFSPSAGPTLALAVLSLFAGAADGAISRHAPQINGLFDGDLFQLEAEGADLNSGGRIEGTWHLPGTPTLVLQGGTLAAGAVVHGDGDGGPSGHLIRLNGGSYVEAIVDRSLPPELPTAAASVPAAGSRWVHINGPSDSIGDPSTLFGLNINAGGVEVALPPGAYGQVSVNGQSAVVLGVAGADEPAVYDIGSLNLNRTHKRHGVFKGENSLTRWSIAVPPHRQLRRTRHTLPAGTTRMDIRDATLERLPTQPGEDADAVCDVPGEHGIEDVVCLGG